MTHVSDEITSQPLCWRRAIDMADVPVLPARGERVAVIGCGTSWFVAQTYAALREYRGHGETDAWSASEFPADRAYDRVVAISRSGATTEILRATAHLPRFTVAITAVPDSPLAVQCDAAVALDFADEKSVVQTRFPTTVLTLLRTHLGEDVTDLPRQAEVALEAPLPAPGFRQYTFLGAGWTSGLAHEAALKLRESAQVWAESYLGMEYRHGPIAMADVGSLVWFLGTLPEGLANEVRVTGAHLEMSALDPQADLVRAQRFAVELAVRRGRDPDAPRHLTRSVILT